MKSAPFLAVCVSLVGCATQTGVVPMGQGIYMVARQAATGFPGLGTLKADALRDAETFCANRAQDFKVLQATENEGPFILGRYPRAEVQFSCVAK